MENARARSVKGNVIFPNVIRVARIDGDDIDDRTVSYGAFNPLSHRTVAEIYNFHSEAE